MAINPAAARLGLKGEDLVAEFLIAKKVEILDRNWRIREGELDLVAQDGMGQILIIEVKTRTTKSFGDPLESIDRQKALRIQRLAMAWLVCHHRLGQPYRIDVAGVIISRSGKVTIDYREGIL